MSREEEHRMSHWNSAYRQSTSASPNYEYMRVRDINETRKVIERESFLEQLDQHRDMLIKRLDVEMRGTCTAENNAQKEFEEYIKPEVEDEEEEFLFDPEDLDI